MQRSHLNIVLFKEDAIWSTNYFEKTLLSIISDMQAVPHLFVKRPGNDFSRNRKISFSDIIRFLLSMNGNTVRKEWMQFWDFQTEMASVPAFFQRRQKILPVSMDFLFHSFSESFAGLETYRGYCLLACDGSDLAVSYNPKDKETHRRHNSLERNEKGYNQLHLKAIYDLQNRIYTDVIIQPGRYPNETGALLDMMKRSKIKEPVLLIVDLGYESYNLLVHAQEKGWKFLIRAKDLVLTSHVFPTQIKNRNPSDRFFVGVPVIL